MQRTDIEWTDYSSGPVKLKLHNSGRCINACVKVSDGCKECYAEKITRRFFRKAEGKFPGYTPQLMKLGEVVLVDKEIQAILNFKPRPPFRHTKPMVFIEDASDIFGEWVTDEMLDRLMVAFWLRKDVIFQLLTKRPERMAAYFAKLTTADGPDPDRWDAARRALWLAEKDQHRREYIGVMGAYPSWPLPNVWLGTSVENNATLPRIGPLIKCPAAVRFLSIEPLLGRLGVLYANLPGIHWVIVGCESRGRYAGRFADGYEAAALSIIEQCQAAGVAVFHKQNVVNGKVSGNPAEWEAYLRVRQFPAGFSANASRDPVVTSTTA